VCSNWTRTNQRPFCFKVAAVVVPTRARRTRRSGTPIVLWAPTFKRQVAFAAGRLGWFLVAGDQGLLTAWRRNRPGHFQVFLTMLSREGAVVELSFTQCAEDGAPLRRWFRKE
jgi:hypothetical protein